MTKDENEDTPLMLAIRTYKKILPNLEQDCNNSLDFMFTSLRSLRSLDPQEYPDSLEIIKTLIKYGIMKVYVSVLASISWIVASIWASLCILMICMISSSYPLAEIADCFIRVFDKYFLQFSKHSDTFLHALVLKF